MIILSLEKKNISQIPNLFNAREKRGVTTQVKTHSVMTEKVGVSSPFLSFTLQIHAKTKSLGQITKWTGTLRP